jgi:hypothetical protein
MWGIGLIHGLVVGLGALGLKLFGKVENWAGSGPRSLSPIEYKALRWRKKRKSWIPNDLYEECHSTIKNYEYKGKSYTLRMHSYIEFKYCIEYMLNGSTKMVRLGPLISAVANYSGIFDDVEVNIKYGYAYKNFIQLKSWLHTKGWDVRSVNGKQFCVYYRA